MGKVKWTKRTYDIFVEEAFLTADEKYILDSRIKGETVTQQCIALNVSRATVNRYIKNIKEKYDIIASHYPDIFPKQYKSKEEEYMDNN